MLGFSLANCDCLGRTIAFYQVFFSAGKGGFKQMMYRSPERSPQDFRDGFFLYSAQAPFYWPRVDLAILFAILFVLSCHVYFPLEFEFRGKSCVE